MVQEEHFKKILDAERLWTLKESDRSQKKVTRRAGVARRKEIIMGRNRIRRREPKNERSKAQGAEMLRSCYT
jgi:hypothetical protein